jgi:hypothetical protein
MAIGWPITPLHAGHVGLLCTAGLLNGVFGQGGERHIARWRSVKHVTEFQEEEGDGSIRFQLPLSGTILVLIRLNSVQRARVVSPGQLCNNLLHKLLVPPRLREAPHVLEVANAKALRNQGIPFPDPGKPINDFGSPTLCLLGGENIPANRPIEHDQFSIDGEAGTKLRGATRS